MDDLISRRVAIDALRNMAVPLYKDLACEDIWERDRTLDNAIEKMVEIPSVDAAPVVRCKDCKYSYIFEPWEGKDAVRYCNQLRWAYAKDSDLPVYDDDFCSHGERREEDAVD